jgi:hypothetical protein
VQMPETALQHPLPALRPAGSVARLHQQGVKGFRRWLAIVQQTVARPQARGGREVAEGEQQGAQGDLVAVQPVLRMPAAMPLMVSRAPRSSSLRE